MKKAFIGAGILFLAGFAGAARMHGTPQGVSVLPIQRVPFATQDQFARDLFRILNDQRVQAGLAALQWDDRLAEAAKIHSQEMAKHQALAHQFAGEPNLRKRLAKFESLRLDRLSENVGYDTTIQRVHEGFMNSPPHRANILSSTFNSVGIGVVQHGGILYVTEDFVHRLPEISDMKANDMVAASFERTRRDGGESRLKRVTNPVLNNFACSMAKQDAVETNKALALPGARYAVAYTAGEPEKLSSSAMKLRDARGVGTYALGTCFARSDSYPNGVYWIVIVLFTDSMER